MKLTCPACGAVSSLDGLLQHDAARAAMAAAYALSAPLGVALLRYMALFRPAARSLTWDRVASLTEELLPMIESGRIERNRREYAVPRESWVLGLEQIVNQRDKLTLPLKSHGYLLEILAGLAEKAEAARVSQQEAIARGETPTGASAAHRPVTPLDKGGQGGFVRPSVETVSAAIASAKSILNQGKKHEATE